MFGLRGTIGVALTLVIAFAAFSTGASAATVKGTTGFTCKEVAAGTGKFTKSHCRGSDLGTGNFEHVAFKEKTTTELKATNEATSEETKARQSLTIRSSLFGFLLQITAGSVTGSGTLSNTVSGKEHLTEGEGSLTFSEVVVKSPSEKACVVEGEKIETAKLKLTTAGQGMAVRFEPVAGDVLASFSIKNCSVAALNGLYELKGTLKGTPEGATINFIHETTTAKNTLRLRGQRAGIEGSFTFSGRDAELGDVTYTPISPTTVETEETPAATGTTAFTCGPASQLSDEAGFSKSHCKAAEAVESGAAYKHTAVPQGSATEVVGTNSGTGSGTETSTPMTLRATISGVNVEIRATGVTVAGSVANGVTGKEHFAEGVGRVSFSGESVVAPAGKGCELFESEANPIELKATTVEQGMAIKITPVTGSVFSRFFVEGCSVEALNGVYEVTGSIKGTPDGATLNFGHTETTTQNTLKVRGQKAGLNGSVIFSGRPKGSGSNYTPLSPTTVGTE